MNRGAEVWTIVVAAGSGSRFGGPKQLAPLAGRQVLDWSILRSVEASDGVVVVVPTELVDDCQQRYSDCAVVAGGATRSESVRAGLGRVPDQVEVILVHDGARPLVKSDVFDRVIAAIADGADAALPGVAVTDTIREREGGVVDRSRLVAVQTPQAFRAVSLRDAHASGADATDDVALVEAIGGKVMVVDGLAENIKITVPDDLVIAEALFTARSTETD